MHSYLRAVGFSRYTRKKDFRDVLLHVIKEADKKSMAQLENETNFVQLDKCFGEDFGISVYGEYNEKGIFEFAYMVPFLQGYGVTTTENPFIERHAARESYAGLCDDFRTGISIIFYVNNTIECIRLRNMQESHINIDGVTLTGLSTEGKILFPINKTLSQKQADKEAVQIRSQLISAAKKGDEKAIETLTLDDLDTFSMVGRRIAKEDVLSIVETYFMPHGIECDQYSILGEILEYRLDKNVYTDENIYIITVNCNEIIFDICINEMDLLGEPKVGRRLKANIWLQGTIRYS